MEETPYKLLVKLSDSVRSLPGSELFSDVPYAL
jgi:hypothetical protein